MSTDIEICNLALSLIGEDEISSLAGTDRVSKACNRHLQSAIDWVTIQREWKFATTRASLSAAVGAPEYGWSTAYDLPADHLRTLDVRSTSLEDDAENYTRWTQENGQILTDVSDGIKIKYLRQEPTEANIPSHVVVPIYHELASRLCTVIAQARGLKDDLRKEAEKYIIEAAAVDGMQGRNQKIRSTRLQRVRMSGGFTAGPYV